MNNKKEKIKQKILIITAFVFIIFGYLNFNLNNKDLLEVSSRNNEINLGDVELVNSKPVNMVNSSYINGIVSNDEINNKDININTIIEESTINTKNSIESNNDTFNYFEETKIERDKMYSEMLETYQKIVDSNTITSDQKAIAMQEISNITNTKNGIMISENLIKNKGFDEAVILVNNGKVNLILKDTKLNKEQISQIQNIIEKQFNVKIENINISFKS